MAKTRSESSSREIAKLRKEIDELEQTLASVKKSNSAAYMLKVCVDDSEKGEYRVLRQFYHLRKDAVHDMEYQFAILFGKKAEPLDRTDASISHADGKGLSFRAEIKKVTII